MTDTPKDLAAPAVEMPLDKIFDTHIECALNPYGAWKSIQSLSAALEAEKSRAEAERDALKAELSEAVGLMQDMRDHGANDYVIDRVLAFLARQNEADT